MSSVHSIAVRTIPNTTFLVNPRPPYQTIYLHILTYSTTLKQLPSIKSLQHTL